MQSVTNVKQKQTHTLEQKTKTEDKKAIWMLSNSGRNLV